MWSATSEEDGAPLRVLQVDSEVWADGNRRRRLQKRVEVVSGLDHAALPAVIGWNEPASSGELVLQRPEGRVLATLLRSGSGDPVAVTRLLSPLAGLLDLLHGNGVVLGDLHPGEVWLAHDGRLTCTALGLTELARPEGDRGAPHPAFAAHLAPVARACLSPEQREGAAPGPRSDVYALAAIMHTLLTGEYPAVPGGREDRAGAASQRWGTTSPALREVLGRGLALDPGRRPETAGELISAARGAAGARRRRRRTAPAAGRTAPAPRSGLRRRAGAAGLLAVAFFAGGAGALAAGGLLESGPRPEARPAPGEARTETLALRHPGTWQERQRVPALPGGVRLRDAMALRPQGRDDTLLVAGLVTGTSTNLLAPGLLERLGGTPPAEPVRLGGLTALRSRDVMPEEDARSLTTYAVPTTRGVATVACVVPAAAVARRKECEAIATTLRLRGDIRELPLGADPRHARRLDVIFGDLREQREIGLRRLAGANTVTGQRERATRLSGSFASAAEALGALTPAAGLAEAQPAVVDALEGVAAAYASLADAAGRRDRPGYNAARSLVVRAERVLVAALAALERHGYRPTA